MTPHELYFYLFLMEIRNEPLELQICGTCTETMKVIYNFNTIYVIWYVKKYRLSEIANIWNYI
jgi:hypothetical protein